MEHTLVPWNAFFLLFWVGTMFRFRNLNCCVAFPGLALCLTVFEGRISSTRPVLRIAENDRSKFLWSVLTSELSDSIWTLNSGITPIGMSTTTYGILTHLSDILCLPLKATCLSQDMISYVQSNFIVCLIPYDSFLDFLRSNFIRLVGKRKPFL